MVWTNEPSWLPLSILSLPILFIAGFLDVLTIYWTYAYGLFMLGDAYWAGLLMQGFMWIPIITILGIVVVPVAIFRGPASWPKGVLTTYRIEFTTPTIWFAPRALRWLPWGSTNAKIHAFASYCTDPSIWSGLLGISGESDDDVRAGLRLLNYFKASVDKKNAWNTFIRRSGFNGAGVWPERSVSVRDATGATALFHVFVNFKTSNGVYAAERMLRAGFDVNAQDRRGNTAIHSGRKVEGALEVVRLLVSNEAYDWNVTNDVGQTATMFWSAVADGTQRSADEGRDNFHGYVPQQRAASMRDALRAMRRERCPDLDVFETLENLLREHAQSDTLHRMPLYDWLWDATGGEMRATYVYIIIRRLVLKCHAEGESGVLDGAEKRLLKFLFTVSMGPATARTDPRGAYRKEMSAMFGAAMGDFESRLSLHYSQLCERSTPSEADLIEKTDKEFVNVRFVHQCPAGLRWATSRDLRAAFDALSAVGAISGISAFSELLSTGRHRFMARAHPEDFHDQSSWHFWARLVAIYLIAACERALPAFDQTCASVVKKAAASAEWGVGNVKRFERTWAKTLEYVAERHIENDADARVGAAGCVLDMMRGSVVAADAAEAVAVCKAIENCEQWTVLKRKNGFREGANAIGGYRDIKYIIRLHASRGDFPTKPAKSSSSSSSSASSAPAPREVRVTPVISVSAPTDESALNLGGPTGEIQVLLQPTATVKKSMHPIYTAARGDYDHPQWRAAN